MERCSSGNYSSEQSEQQSIHCRQQQQVTEIDMTRKRKRMISNRESARRSRMRKQKHVDDMTTLVNQLKNDKNEIVTQVNITTQLYLNIEAENSILRAQLCELTHRLNSLNDIVFNCCSSSSCAAGAALGLNDPLYSSIYNTYDHEDDDDDQDYYYYDDDFLNPNWNFLSLNQQMIPADHVLMY